MSSAPYSWRYWLEGDGEGRVHLWAECQLPTGEVKASGFPITREQVRALAASLGDGSGQTANQYSGANFNHANTANIGVTP